MKENYYKKFIIIPFAIFIYYFNNFILVISRCIIFLFLNLELFGLCIDFGNLHIFFIKNLLYYIILLIFSFDN